MNQPRRRDLLWIAGVSLALNGALALDIGLSNPEYLRDSGTNANPDALHYLLLGRNFWDRGEYSRQDGPPYTPDMLRTPVYPLVVGALDRALGAWGVYAFQVLCRTATALALYWFGCAVFGRRIALLAALLFAVDPMLAILDFEAMSEPLFTLLATLAILLWLRDHFGAAGETPRWPRTLRTGVLLGLAILTRPTGLYLPVVLGVMGLAVAWKRRRPAVLRDALLMTMTAYLVVAPWVVRNQRVFGVARVSTADTINLVYFAGAGAYSVEHGITLPEAQEMVRREFGLVSLLHSNNHWHADRGVKELDDEQRAVLFNLLTRYPRSLVVATLTGIGKALLAHNVDSYAHMTGRTWHGPGLGRLLRGQFGEFARQFFRNDLVLVILFVGQVVFAVGVLLAGLAGVVIGLRCPQWRPAILCLLTIALYYVLTIAVVGVDAYARHRSMVVPLWCIGAAMTFVRLFRRAE